jgi:membrane-bound lytic murein transglycosylase D
MKIKRKAFLLLFAGFLLSLAFCSSKTPPQTVVTPPITSPQDAQPPAPPLAEEKPPQESPPPVAEAQQETKEESAGQEAGLLTGNEEPSVLLEEALNTYQDGLAAWEKGDRDAALQALDEAYALILKAHLPTDSPLLQEKNDLRLLIAQRIQQIYASRLVTVGDNHRTIPLEENKDVSEEIVSFQTKERAQFEEAYMRSGLYRGMILEELRKEGLPDELSWLPMIESWFKARALSKERALGLWQFIASTGYRFGLKRDRWVDERMDPVKSTQAAVKYLLELHSFFGDWTTALAGYNCGEIRVQNVIRTQRIDYLDNFWDLYRQLPRETARFVPRFIAALLIINNPQKYRFNLPEASPPLQFELAVVNQPFKLSALAAALGVDGAALAILNPELRHDSTPAGEYALRVPPGCAGKVALVMSSLPKWIPPEAQYTWHYVKRGETLSTIAARYRTSVSAIVRLNGLRSQHYLRIGQRLKIPGRGVAVSTAKPVADSSASAQKKVPYTVRSGDTLYSIAQSYDMNLDEFLALNGLSSDTKIYPGQQLWVTSKD